MTGADIQLVETITVASVIVGTLVAIAGVVAVIYGAKWKTAAQVEAANASAWEGTANRLERDLAELREQLHTQREEIHALRTRIAELEHLPDVAAVHAALKEHDDKTSVAMRDHDAHAEDRAKRIITVMEEIRDNLQSDRKDAA